MNKKRKTFVLIVLCLSAVICLDAQNKLVLQHKNRPNKKKSLDLEYQYRINTRDTSFADTPIISFTDSSLSVEARVKTGKIHTENRLGKTRDKRDTLYTVSWQVTRLDTVEILFSDIKIIRKAWFKKRGWLKPFGMLAFGAVGSVILLPVAIIDEGREGLKGWARFEAILIGITAPPIFIGTRSTKYNLEKKWVLKTEK